MKAYELKHIIFPNCGSSCEAVKYFGVCECESICPWKFSKDGEPKKVLGKPIKPIQPTDSNSEDPEIEAGINFIMDTDFGGD